MILAHTLSPEVRAALVSPYAIQASPTFMLSGSRVRGQFAADRARRARRASDYRGRHAVARVQASANLQDTSDLSPASSYEDGRNA